jgi:hypothetical protein
MPPSLGQAAAQGIAVTELKPPDHKALQEIEAVCRAVGETAQGPLKNRNRVRWKTHDTMIRKPKARKGRTAPQEAKMNAVLFKGMSTPRENTTSAPEEDTKQWHCQLHCLDPLPGRRRGGLTSSFPGSPSKIAISLGCAAKQWSGSLTTQPIFIIRCELSVHAHCRKVDSNTLLSIISGIFHARMFQHMV